MPRLQGRSCVNCPVQSRASAARLHPHYGPAIRNNKSNGRDHERANRRPARPPPRRPRRSAAGQAGNARAVEPRGCSGCRTPSSARSTREPSPASTVLVARRGQIGWFDAIGRQSPAAAAPMAHDTHLPHLLDDQADRLDRHHDAAGGRPLPAERSRRKIHSGVRRHQGRRREQRQARARAGASGR